MSVKGPVKEEKLVPQGREYREGHTEVEASEKTSLKRGHLQGDLKLTRRGWGGQDCRKSECKGRSSAWARTWKRVRGAKACSEQGPGQQSHEAITQGPPSRRGTTCPGLPSLPPTVPGCACDPSINIHDVSFWFGQ